MRSGATALASEATSTHIRASLITHARVVVTPGSMPIQQLVSATLAGLAFTALGLAVAYERAMQRHRQPGVTYRQVTFRRDGGWRRGDLFTDTGLRYQRRASSFATAGAILWVASLLAYVLLDGR